MNWKNRLTNYNFWVSIVSAIILVLQALKIKFDVAYINEIVTAVLGLLVVIGIINDPTKTYTKTSQTKENQTQNLTTKTKIVVPQKEQKQENVLPENLNLANEETKENAKKNFENLKNGTKNDKIFEKTSQNLEILEKNLQNEQNVCSALTENLIPNNQENEIAVDPVQNNLPADEIENLNAEFSEHKTDNQNL